MSPVPDLAKRWVHGVVVPKPTNPGELVLEAWAMGYLVGSLVIMGFITLANMRRGVLLHKACHSRILLSLINADLLQLILLELVMGLWQGFYLFFNSPVHAWWLSVSAIFLNASWSLHNVIAWMKIKPFLPKPASYLFIGTVILVQPYWIAEIYANFAYFHGVNTIFLRTRPWEALCRDPWWIITTVYLFWIIKTQYEMGLKEILRISPRFAIMLLAMIMSMVFILLDILCVTRVITFSGLATGINPFWKLAFVFKCLTDSVVLDDFKMALDRLRAFKISRLGSFSADMSDSRNRNNGELVATWEEMEREANALQQIRSPDGDYIHPSNFPFKPRRHRKPKDSVFSNDPIDHLAPEDMVHSALDETPLRTLELAHTDMRKPQHHFMDDLDSRTRGMTAEADYAAALREVQRNSRTSVPSSSNSSGRAAPPGPKQS